MHRRSGDEHAGPIAQLRERSERELAPLVVARVSELGQVGLRNEDVERPRLGHELERAGVHDALVRDGPGVERVPGREVVRELGPEPAGEVLRQRLERDSRGLGLVGEQRALAARLGDGRDPRAARPSTASEDLERLDELVEVLDLDRAVPLEDGRERAARADQGTRMGERGAGGGLRPPDLQADDDLPGERAPLERRDELLGAADGLQKQADRARVPSSSAKNET